MMMTLLALSPAVGAKPEPERWLRFLPKEPAAPVQPSVVEKPATLPTPAPVGNEGGRVDLNHADVEALDAGLDGVGRTKAEAIVAWRSKHGPFRSVDQLDEVPGFGPTLVERNRDRVVLK